MEELKLYSVSYNDIAEDNVFGMYNVPFYISGKSTSDAENNLNLRAGKNVIDLGFRVSEVKIENFRIRLEAL